jgi:hypothetical protein
MILFRSAGMGLLAVTVLVASQAFALTVDDKSMNTPDGAPRFSDPDEQLPTTGLSVHLNSAGRPENGNIDPSTVRYDYDSASGTYIPHRQ